MNLVVAAAGWAEAGSDELFPPELGIGLCVIAVMYAIICPLYWCFTKKPTRLAFFFDGAAAANAVSTDAFWDRLELDVPLIV